MMLHTLAAKLNRRQSNSSIPGLKVAQVSNPLFMNEHLITTLKLLLKRRKKQLRLDTSNLSGLETVASLCERMIKAI